MHTISILSSVVLRLSPIVLSHPLESSPTLVIRDDPQPSSYPYGDAPTNMFKWINWDPNSDTDKADGQRIARAFMEWQDLVRAGAKAAADTNGATFKRWFGEKPLSDIKAVFAKMWDGQNPTINVANMVVDRKDYDNIEPTHPRMAAYTTPGTGKFHVCAFGLQRPLLVDIDCSTLDDSCSTKMRSLPMTLLHEMTHYDKIGSDAIDEAIGDYLPGGAYNDFNRDNDEKELNAQNYAWLAGEQYFADKCNKVFQDPAPGVKATGDDEEYDETDDGPTSTSPAPPPPSSTAPPPPPPPPPYAAGVCGLHVTETQNCDDDTNNLFANVTLVDNSKTIIGQTSIDPAKNPIGDPINVADPLKFMSKLPNPIVITGEHENDYIQFTYGTLSWTSRTTSGPATCSVGGWDPRDGPICTVFGDQYAVNNMDCLFPC